MNLSTPKARKDCTLHKKVIALLKISQELIGPLQLGSLDHNWLVRSSPERAVRVRALARDIVLCSWARHLTLTVPLPGVQMGTGEFNAGG